MLILTLFVWLYRDTIMRNIWRPEKLELTQTKAIATSIPSVPSSSITKKPEDKMTSPYVVPPPQKNIPKTEEINSDQITGQLFSSLERLSREENWQLVLKSLFELWEEEKIIPQEVKTGQLPKGTSLNIWEIYGNLTLLKSLNYPAIVELKRPKHDSGVYVVLKRLRGDEVVLVGEGEVVLPLKIFYDLWYGHAYIIWKDFEDLPRAIHPGASSLAVTWLQHNLKYLNLFDGQENGYYDSKTRDAVIRLQKEKYLYVDGIVGPQTKMVLYSLLDVYYRKPVLLGEPRKKEFE